MSNRFQVIIVEQLGKIKGYTYKDPIDALFTLADLMSAKEPLIEEILFRQTEINDVVIQVKEGIRYAAYKESTNNQNLIDFYSGKQDVKEIVEGYRKGYRGRYYSKVILYDLCKKAVVQTIE